MSHRSKKTEKQKEIKERVLVAESSYNTQNIQLASHWAKQSHDPIGSTIIDGVWAFVQVNRS